MMAKGTIYSCYQPGFKFLRLLCSVPRGDPEPPFLLASMQHYRKYAPFLIMISR